SEKRERCSSVPIAPSSTRMRLDAISRSAFRTSAPSAGEGIKVVISFLSLRPDRFGPKRFFSRGCSPYPLLAQSEQVADRIDEIGAIHGVEMELVDTTVDEVDHLLGRNGCGNQLPCVHIIVEALEPRREPGGNAGSRLGGEIGRLLEVLNGNDARHNGDVDATGANAVEITEIDRKSTRLNS